MIIRDMGEWLRYSLQYRDTQQVPDSPPSWPVIVRSQVLDHPEFVCHDFYTVEDYEKPTEETEYMNLLPEYLEFGMVALKMLGCNFEDEVCPV